MADPRQLSKRERQIMDVIFARGEATVSQVIEGIPDAPMRGALRTLLRMDFTRDRARLARCEVPTLVIWGTADKVNRPSGGPWLAHTMPNCDLHLFARTGHWAQYEQADRFNNLVLAWLEGAA